MQCAAGQHRRQGARHNGDQRQVHHDESGDAGHRSEMHTAGNLVAAE
jgi:hypothetical protein